MKQNYYAEPYTERGSVWHALGRFSLLRNLLAATLLFSLQMNEIFLYD